MELFRESIPQLTGNIEEDFSNLYEYVYKLQNILRFDLSNLQTNNFNQKALSTLFADAQIDFNSSKGKEIGSIIAFDNGLFLGGKLKRTEPTYKAKAGDVGLFIEFTGKIYAVKDTMTEIGG